MNTDTMLRPPKNFFWLPTVGLLLGLAAGVRGQEAVQMSIAGADAAAARHKAASTLGYYNLKLGPTAWNFGAGLGLDYNSNVYYTENNPQGDFIFAPQINTRMRWPVRMKSSRLPRTSPRRVRLAASRRRIIPPAARRSFGSTAPSPKPLISSRRFRP